MQFVGLAGANESTYCARELPPPMRFQLLLDLAADGFPDAVACFGAWFLPRRGARTTADSM